MYMSDNIKKRIKNLDETMDKNLINALFVQNNINFFDENIHNTLRHMAVYHLENGNGVVARSFRGEYACVDPHNSYKNFIAQQIRNGAWMTDIELTALGELFGVSIVVTRSLEGADDKTFSLYNAGPQSTVLHFKNTNNTHWEYINFKNEVVETAGDGNCGYHAFTKGLKDLSSVASLLKQEAEKTSAEVIKTTSTEEKIIKQEDKNDNKKNDAIATTINQPIIETSQIKVQNTSSQTSKEKEEEKEILAIKKQQEILHKIVKTIPTANELEQVQKQEAERIAKLPREEQQQIAEDYKLALKLAMEDNNTQYLRQIINKPNLINKPNYLTFDELHQIRMENAIEDNRFNFNNHTV